ncbi:hypothetical protein AA11826_0516 [Komagataeibacter oboediens DSM 11826]|nr:hypothetical protein AA11826_0516 [Komagataeibacter oboediens DSM 11826]
MDVGGEKTSSFPHDIRPCTTYIQTGAAGDPIYGASQEQTTGNTPQDGTAALIARAGRDTPPAGDAVRAAWFDPSWIA